MKNEAKKEIGGSRIASVMGLNRWQSPLALWAELTEKIPPKETNEAMELGTELEDFVARKFTKKTGIKVRRDSRTKTHPKHDFLVAHIDRSVVGTDEILECKTCGSWKAKEWDNEDIPIEYVLQCNWYMGICEKDKCWIACLVGGQRFIVKHITFDEALYEKQVAAAVTFWKEFVEKDEPPVAVGDDQDLLKELYPDASETFLEIEDAEARSDIDTAIEHRFEVMKEIERAKEEKETIDAKLKQIVKDNAGIQTEKWRVAWPVQSRKEVNTDKLKEDGLYEQYVRINPTRVLRVTKKGEKK